MPLRLSAAARAATSVESLTDDDDRIPAVERDSDQVSCVQRSVADFLRDGLRACLIVKVFRDILAEHAERLRGVATTSDIRFDRRHGRDFVREQEGDLVAVASLDLHETSFDLEAAAHILSVSVSSADCA